MRANAKALLEQYGLRPKRHFGQNFLMDEQLAAKIAELATTPSGGTVVEIGAGVGALTWQLLARAHRVIAIERDRELVPILRAELQEDIAEGRLALLETDAKACNWLELFVDAPRPHVVAGNLPYQITGPLLEKVTGVAQAIQSAVFLVQLEVANRLSAAPSTPEYGALSVFVQNRFVPRRAFVVRRGAFYPQPDVDSAVILLEPRARAIAEESERFRGLVRAAFGQRRKTLRNAWRALPGVETALLLSAAERAKVDLSLRGEALSVEAFARVARELES